MPTRHKCPTCKDRGEYLVCDRSGKDYDGDRILRCGQCEAGLKLMLQEVEKGLDVALNMQICLEKEIQVLEAERKDLKSRLRKAGKGGRR